MLSSAVVSVSVVASGLSFVDPVEADVGARDWS
jgi:hypothetical protein